MPIDTKAYAMSPLVAPSLGIMRVIAADDAALAEYFTLELLATYVAIRPKVGDLRIQDFDDTNNSDYIQFSVDDAQGFVDITTPGTNPFKFENDVVIVPSAAAAQGLAIRNTGDTGDVLSCHEDGRIDDDITALTGTILNLFYGAGAILAGALIGINLDLLTNVTLNAQNITGLQIQLPAAYAAGNEYAIHAVGGGATFNALYSVGAAGVIAGLFGDGTRSLTLADGTNALTVIVGNCDFKAGQIICQFTSQAGDPVHGAAAGQVEDQAIATWTDTNTGKHYIGTSIGGAIHKVEIT